MKRATREWIDKAEGDYAVAGREFAAATPVFDAVCFHAQQCAEKYLKALLQERGIEFPRTHDLVALVALAEGAGPALASLRPDLARLTAFSVAPRCPGTSTTLADADAAMNAARRARNALQMTLGCDPRSGTHAVHEGEHRQNPLPVQQQPPADPAGGDEAVDAAISTTASTGPVVSIDGTWREPPLGHRTPGAREAAMVGWPATDRQTAPSRLAPRRGDACSPWSPRPARALDRRRRRVRRGGVRQTR